MKIDIYSVSRVAEFVGSDGKTNCIKVSENYWHEDAGDYFYTLYERQKDGTEIALLDNEYDSILYKLCDKLNSKADLLQACIDIVEGIRYIKNLLPEQMKKPYQSLLTAIRKAKK